MLFFYQCSFTRCISLTLVFFCDKKDERLTITCGGRVSAWILFSFSILRQLPSATAFHLVVFETDHQVVRPARRAVHLPRSAAGRRRQGRPDALAAHQRRRPRLRLLLAPAHVILEPRELLVSLHRRLGHMLPSIAVCVGKPHSGH